MSRPKAAFGTIGYDVHDHGDGPHLTIKAKDSGRGRKRAAGADAPSADELFSELLVELQAIRNIAELEASAMRFPHAEASGVLAATSTTSPILLYKNRKDYPVLAFVQDSRLNEGTRAAWTAVGVNNDPNGRHITLGGPDQTYKIILRPNEEIWWTQSGGGGAGGDTELRWAISDPRASMGDADAW